MTLISTAVSYGIGLPLGLLLCHGRRRHTSDKWLNRTVGVIVNALEKRAVHNPHGAMLPRQRPLWAPASATRR